MGVFGGVTGIAVDWVFLASNYPGTFRSVGCVCVWVSGCGIGDFGVLGFEV